MAAKNLNSDTEMQILKQKLLVRRHQRDNKSIEHLQSFIGSMNARERHKRKLLSLRLQREKEKVARLECLLRNQQKQLDRPLYKKLFAL